jgi:hypothetical protein
VDADTLDSKLPARTTITQTQLSMYSAPFTARTGGFSFGGFCYLWQGKRADSAAQAAAPLSTKRGWSRCVQRNAHHQRAMTTAAAAAHARASNRHKE